MSTSADISVRRLIDGVGQSDAYAKALSPDCKYFMAMPISVAVGYENLIYGESLPGLGGKNGVTESNVKFRPE